MFVCYSVIPHQLSHMCPCLLRCAAWLIRKEELANLVLIGQGASSTVYRAEWHNMPVAVKKIIPVRTVCSVQ